MKACPFIHTCTDTHCTCHSPACMRTCPPVDHAGVWKDAQNHHLPHLEEDAGPRQLWDKPRLLKTSRPDRAGERSRGESRGGRERARERREGERESGVCRWESTRRWERRECVWERERGQRVREILIVLSSSIWSCPFYSYSTFFFLSIYLSKDKSKYISIWLFIYLPNKLDWSPDYLCIYLSICVACLRINTKIFLCDYLSYLPITGLITYLSIYGSN